MDQHNPLLGNNGGMPNMSYPPTMQRSQPGALAQNIFVRVMQQVHQSSAQLTNWAMTFDKKARAAQIMQLLTSLRALNTTQDPSHINKCFQIAIQYESRAIQEAPTKEAYQAMMQQKLQEVAQKRQQNAPHLLAPGGPMGVGMPGNPAAQTSNMLNANPNANFQPNPAMQPNAMQNPQMPRQMVLNPSNTMDPSLLSQNHQQPPPQNTMQMQPTPMQAPRPPLSAEQQVQQQAFMVAKHFYDQMSDDEKNVKRTQFLNQFPDVTRARITQGNQDPLLKLLANHAMKQRAQNGGNWPRNFPGLPGVNGNSANNHGPGMQAMNGFPQHPNSQQQQLSGPNFDLTGLIGQQAHAMKSQDAGEQVVPASNNPNLAMNNQMGMPQNVNPQMLNNMGQNGGQPMAGSFNPQQLMLQRQQAENQARERLQKQLLAQQHQHTNQQSLLRGQPGGLTEPNSSNGTQLNSPALPMLNRPLLPPGQNPPATPQSANQMPMPSTPVNGANALRQHHQNMVNQNNATPQQFHGPGGQAGQPNAIHNGNQPIPPWRVKQIVQSMPDNLKSKFEELPFAQQVERVNMWTRRPQETRNMLPNGAVQQQTLSPAVNNSSNAGTGFDPSQNAPTQHPQVTQQIQQIQMKAMDMRPFPKAALNSLGITATPEQVVTWAQLKHYILQNQATLPPNLINKVVPLQLQILKALPQERMHIAQLVRQLQGAAQQGQNQPPGNSMQPSPAFPDRPAPQAQMVPPVAPMQPPAQNGGLGPGANQRGMQQLPPVTPREIQHFRSRVPQAQQMTDDQLRTYLARLKLARMQSNEAAQQSHATSQPERPANMIPSGFQNNLGNGNQLMQRTPTQNATHPAGQQIQQAFNQMKQPPSSNDDVVEISSQPVQPHMSQPSQMQPNRSQPAANRGSAESAGKLAQNQRNDLMRQESLRKAQMAAGSNTGTTQNQNGSQPAPPTGQPPNMTPTATSATINRLMHEVRTENPKGPGIQMDSETLANARNVLRRLSGTTSRIDSLIKALIHDPAWTEPHLKELLRVHHLVALNMRENDYCSLTLPQINQFQRLVAKAVMDFKKVAERFSQMNAVSQPSAQQAAAKPTTAAPTKPTQAAPPTRQEPQQTGQQTAVRKSSSAQRAPPAPTDNKSFDWGTPQAGHGVPKYDKRNELTADKLKFPPNKKRKTDSQVSTPVAQVSTPVASGATPGKAATAAAMKKAQPAPAPQKEVEKEPEKPTFRCTEPGCEGAHAIFEEEEQLKLHQETEHTPISNPLEYLIAEGAKAAGCDLEGNPLPVPQPPQPLRGKPAAVAAMRRANATQQARGSKAQVKDATPKAPVQPKTFGELLSQKAGSEHVNQKSNVPSKAASVEAETKQPDELAWLREAQCPEMNDLCEGIGPDIEAIIMRDYEEYLAKSEAEWREENPDLYPSSSSQASTPSSSVDAQQSPENRVSPSQRLKLTVKMHEWDPFGEGPLPVPKALADCAEAQKKKEAYEEEKKKQMEMGSPAGEASDGESPNSKKRKSPAIDDDEFPFVDYGMCVDESTKEWWQ